MMTETITPKPAHHAAGNSSKPPGRTRTGPSYSISRKIFLQLPLAERRRILKAQAMVARAYYATSTEWQGWDAADLTSTRNE